MAFIAGAAIVGSVIAADAANQAGDKAAGGADRATQAQLQMFREQNLQQLPYRQAGTSALGTLAGYSGLPGYRVAPQAPPPGGYDYLGQKYADQSALRGAMEENYRKESGGLDPNASTDVQRAIDGYVKQYMTAQNQSQPVTADPLAGSLLHQFNADDLKTNLAPNYEWIKQQGIGATTNALNAGGGQFSGNTLKGITDYATNLAGNSYQQAFSNYNTNQTNIFNRLASIAGIGQTANAQTGQLAGAMSPGIASTITGAGNAQAAGTMGAGNAISGGINNASGWYTLGQITNPKDAANTPMVEEMIPGQFSLGNVAYGG